MIVANDISARDAGFSVDTNRVTLLYAPNPALATLVEPLELMSKEQVAQVVWERVTTLLASL